MPDTKNEIDANDYIEAAYDKPDVIDEDIRETMNEDIAHAPQDTNSLIERLDEHNSTSPALSGGDVDADWEDANDSGEESFAGSNPTPDQDNVEENAAAMGLSYEDNEEIGVEEKVGKRDEDRWELREASKEGDMI